MLPKYFSILLPNLGSHKYFPYKPHKLFWVFLQILPFISHILPNLGSHTNTYHTITKIGLQNYTIFIKSPNSFSLWEKSKKPNKTLLQIPLLHSTLKPIATWHSYKTCCYTALLLSLLLHGNIFTKSQTSYKKPKYYFGNYLQNAQILFWKLFTKSPNTILATFYKSSILFQQLFTKAQYYFGNYLQKPNNILATIYKSPNIIWQNNYIMLKAQNYSLVKTYFHKLKSLTHGKHKLLMIYYSSFKATKFMGTMPIFFVINSNYKSPYILLMEKLFILQG